MGLLALIQTLFNMVFAFSNTARFFTILFKKYIYIEEIFKYSSRRPWNLKSALQVQWGLEYRTLEYQTIWISVFQYSEGSNSEHSNTEYLRKQNVSKFGFRKVPILNGPSDAKRSAIFMVSLDRIINEHFFIFYIKCSRLVRPFRFLTISKNQTKWLHFFAISLDCFDRKKLHKTVQANRHFFCSDFEWLGPWTERHQPSQNQTCSVLEPPLWS